MTWLADILKPQQESVTPVSIELANTDYTNGSAPAQTTKPYPAAVVIEPRNPHNADGFSAKELERHLVALSQPRLPGLAQRVAATRSRLLDPTAAAQPLDEVGAP